jgi:DNA polymerase
MRRGSLTWIDWDDVSWPTSLEGLDFETFGAVNLPKHGLDRYVSDASFTPLIASVSDGRSAPRTFDFVRRQEDWGKLREYIDNAIAWGRWFTAHNVGFERAVLRKMGYGDEVLCRIIDSAVVARAQGAASHLEAAAPQLTDLTKLEVGKDLIMKFSVPTAHNGGRPYTKQELEAEPILLLQDWEKFAEYCEIDAAASREIVMPHLNRQWLMQEHRREWYTYLMNREGWDTDLDLVQEFKLRYEDNCSRIVAEFFALYGENRFTAEKLKDTFLNSTPQMKAWCEERGIKTSSFDAEHIEKLLQRLNKAMSTMNPQSARWQDYQEVQDLLTVKQELGGSSLKKLQTILDLVGKDGRLRNQYMHLGAGQTYRTTGKGVQMQNLKRLSSAPLDFDDEINVVEDADNTTLAQNLRQVFYSGTDKDARLIVGDFSSVESRGLAWVAGADWKIDAFREGKDLYIVQAAAIYNTTYESIDKKDPRRQVGKVGELGCGYGAGPKALGAFAGKMGIAMSETEAGDLVNNWRETNPEVVDLWARLHEALTNAVQLNAVQEVKLAHGLVLRFTPYDAPASLQKQHPGVRSLRMELYGQDGKSFIMERVFQGTYMRGRDVCFYKPSERKTGDLWSNHYRDPKTGQIVFYKLYGGKLTGILVQSMCREIFFIAVHYLYWNLRGVKNARVVGQFHDELVVQWKPSSRYSLDSVKSLVDGAMSYVTPDFAGFPLAADIKQDYRYTK